MWQLDNLELKQYLDEIVSCDAFELHKTALENGRYEFYIPYVMNDALECFLLFSDAQLTGSPLSDITGKFSRTGG